MSRVISARRLTGAVLLVALTGASSRADEPDTLFANATQALAGGRPADAIADLEALADRGVLDAAMSFDRGLAYAQRVRIGGEQPGDLGRAAHGFEEARTLTRDPKMIEDASAALATIRAEVARRRARAGSSVELEQNDSLGDSVVHLVSENTWALLSAAMSLLLGVGLFVIWLARPQARRIRIGGSIAVAVAAPLLLASILLTLSARDSRLHRREGVLVSASARPSDARGVALPSSGLLPEAARVQIMSSNSAWTQIRWGTLVAWVPSPMVRPLARE